MIMPYDERKQAVQEDFGAFHIDMGYSIKDTFYASIGEAEYSSLYTKTDECCIYVVGGSTAHFCIQRWWSWYLMCMCQNISRNWAQNTWISKRMWHISKHC